MLDRKVAEAASSLCEGWFAINPAVHELVANRLRNGYYGEEPAPLLGDLMSDAALFGYCLKNLAQLAARGEIAAPAPLDISGYFRNAGMGKLRELLRRDPAGISTHKFSEGAEAQAGMLHQMVVGTQASELLANAKKFPRGTGFAASLLRHLGLTLIAFNFPHVLKQAVADVRKGQRLDYALLKYLGYSPRVLALAIAKEWGLSSEYLYLLGETRALEAQFRGNVQHMRISCESLNKICEVGETLSRLHHPGLYPEAKRSWFDAKTHIARSLGPRGLEMLESKIRRSVDVYCAGIDERLKSVFAVQEFTEIPGPMPRPVDTPPVDDVWPPQLHEPLANFYHMLRRGGDKARHLKRFGKVLAGRVGFSGGAVFTYDIETSVLSPRYQFGDCDRTMKHPVSVSPLLPSLNPLVEAFRSGRCVYEHTPWSAEGVNFVAQAFGGSERVGVLYLEAGPALRLEDTSALLKIFGALLKALDRCIEVETPSSAEHQADPR